MKGLTGFKCLICGRCYTNVACVTYENLNGQTRYFCLPCWKELENMVV